MRLFPLALFIGVLMTTPVWGQYKYGLIPADYNYYVKSLKEHPEKELVDLGKYIPGIVLDIRYATTNNFTGERIYDQAKAYARKPVAESLIKIQEELKLQGLGVKIFDAYRPYRATVKFYEVYGDTTYVASPFRGSRHNRGCALDLTLIDLKSGKELRMPTEYDSFSRQAWPSTPVADAEVRKNRHLLITIMEKHGFRVNSSEWWHYDFRGWKNFEVLDIDFAALE
ncbi:MAG: M15 family metallopeptidase [Chryseosolibacter sp.]